MRRLALIALLTALFAAEGLAQKEMKPWTEWSQKEAEKIWNDSAWAQTQTEVSSDSGTPTVVSKTTSNRTEATRLSSANQTPSGEKKAPLSANYRVRFLSARPIREAFVRMMEIQPQGMSPEGLAQLRTFIDRDFGAYIVVTVSIDGTDQKRVEPAMQAISSAAPDTLKNSTYLERKDGKRVLLMDFRAPIQDGLGAKFVFPRNLDGRPFLEGDSGEVRFYCEVGSNVKLSQRFKVSEMMYQGKLEY